MLFRELAGSGAGSQLQLEFDAEAAAERLASAAR
jgi:hypothetical protein